MFTLDRMTLTILTLNTVTHSIAALNITRLILKGAQHNVSELMTLYMCQQNEAHIGDQLNDTRGNDMRHYDNQHNDEQQNRIDSVIMLNVIMLSFFRENVTLQIVAMPICMT